MSVLVKGMKMPKGCWWHENGFYRECPLFDADHYCSQLRRNMDNNDGNRPHDCPLIEVSTPHGRLIDADEVPYFASSPWKAIATQSEIEKMPTIIEAEEGEPNA